MMIIAIAEWRVPDTREGQKDCYFLKKKAFLLKTWDDDTSLRNKLKNAILKPHTISSTLVESLELA